MAAETEGMPRIWFSRAPTCADVVVPIKAKMAHDADVLPYINRFDQFKQVAGDPAPQCLVRKRPDVEIPASSKDAFHITDGLLVVSEKTHDVLMQFDLGATQLLKVPLYLSEARDEQMPGRFFLLHIAEHKDAFVPEASENIYQGPLHPPVIPNPKAVPDDRWSPKFDLDQLAVRASAAEGVDLWADRMLKRRFFASDRLKKALDAAKLKDRVIRFQPATVVP